MPLRYRLAAYWFDIWLPEITLSRIVSVPSEVMAPEPPLPAAVLLETVAFEIFAVAPLSTIIAPPCPAALVRSELFEIVPPVIVNVPPAATRTAPAP